jgi:hypothetical protein
VPNRKELEKEVKVHRMMKHVNVLEFMDARLVDEGEEGGKWVGGLFVLLELAAGGDLFDKIGALLSFCSLLLDGRRSLRVSSCVLSS